MRIYPQRSLTKTQNMYLAVSLIMVALIGFLDHMTGFELSFSIFYVIPVAIAAWNLGYFYSTVISLIAGTVWIIVDISSGHRYSFYLIPFWNGFVRLLFFLIISYLLTGMKENVNTLKRLSDTDSLTGIDNGRGFEKRFIKALVEAERKKQYLSIAYLDLDNFKFVNDKFGHSTGDKLLYQVANCIKGCLREADIVARMGGDEFIALLTSTDYETSDAVIKRIRDQVSLMMKENGWPVTFSAGMITFKAEDIKADDVIHSADELMYEVKNSTKNGFLHKLMK